MIALLLAALALPQFRVTAGPATPAAYPGENADLALARRFAPVFHHRLAGDPATHRFDAITRFDFDGDWIGNNNWANAADPKFPLKAYVYYAVVETEAFYFLSYTVFHPRDWSLLQPLLEAGMDQVQQNEKLAEWLPPSLREQIEVNHENDLEGAQVIVAKAAEPRVVAVETIAHNRFHRYRAEELQFEGERPALYIESQKHGIYKYPHTATGLARLFDAPEGPLRVYRFTGVAEDAEKAEAGYDLLPIYSTLWKRARQTRQPNETFGATQDFGEVFCHSLGPLAARAGAWCKLSTIATALRGDIAGKNRATLPWGWSSLADPALNNGVWFLDPAQIIRQHFADWGDPGGYVSNPFLGLFR